MGETVETLDLNNHGGTYGLATVFLFMDWF